MPSDSDELLLGGQDRKGTRWLASSRGAGGPRDPRVWPFRTPGTTTTLPPPHSHSQKPGTGEFHQEGKGGSDNVSGRYMLSRCPGRDSGAYMHAYYLYSKSQSASPLPPKRGSP